MKKRLYKIEQGKKLDGVCGGIAEYFDIDPTLVRLAWILFTACAGSGIIAYIIAAIIMPRKSDIIEFESILKRGVLGTRIRDFYDIYMLLNTQTKNIDFNTLKDAIYSTAEHRNTINIIKDWSKIIEQLNHSDIMKKQWERYQKNNFYAKEIKYEDLIESLKQVGRIL